MAEAGATELWFDRPADKWIEALPLGNGRLGAMVFGRTGAELIQLNDGTAWSGSPASNVAGGLVDRDTATDAIAAARRAVAASDFAAAEAQVKRLQHRYSQTYLPFADLRLEFTLPGEVGEYRRTLDLSRAVHTVRFTVDGHPVVVETHVSRPHGVLSVEIACAHLDGLGIAVSLDSQLRILDSTAGESGASLLLRMPSDVAPTHEDVPIPVTWSEDECLSMQGAVSLRWAQDGRSVGPMRAAGVHTARLVLATETTFTGLGRQPVGTAAAAKERADERLTAAFATRPQELRRAHEEDHGSLFSRAELATGPVRDLPLDRRLDEGNAHPHGVLALDPALAGLLYNYGRYLLIASSRPGNPPANLQGIWNDLMRPPWSSNYTTNINVQMNYWQAEVAQLAECAEPLYDLIDTLAITGRTTAERLYGAAGWVAHHNTDAWGYTEPVGLGVAEPKWAFWPMAAPWLVRELWEHLLFGAPDDFARDRAWPPIRSAAEFCLHWLQENNDGTLGTSPSTSPENQFRAGGAAFAVAASSTLDLLLIGDLLDMVISLADRLSLDSDPVVDAARRARPRIPEPVISADGRIREWGSEFPDDDPLHRHLSPLYFLHPGDRQLTPALAAAASRTLDARGDESTGWSLVWKLAMRARLRQPQKVTDLLALVFRNMELDRGHWIGGLYSNFLAAHPPFQIDGNFGFVAGISEALVQSHRGEIELLPALPGVLPAGSIRGLVARPGVAISMTWRDGALEQADFEALTASGVGEHVVRLGAKTIRIQVPEGGTATVTPSEF